jgi:hypothetical protein
MRILEASLPVVQLPERGEILRCLLTFIFPVTPLVPSTPDRNYGTPICRSKVSNWNCTNPHPWKHRSTELTTHLSRAITSTLCSRTKVRASTRSTSNRASHNFKTVDDIEDFGNKLDIMSGASLYELWKYHERVRDILASDLTDLGSLVHGGTITGPTMCRAQLLSNPELARSVHRIYRKISEPI